MNRRSFFGMLAGGLAALFVSKELPAPELKSICYVSYPPVGDVLTTERLREFTEEAWENYGGMPINHFYYIDELAAIEEKLYGTGAIERMTKRLRCP